MIGSSTEIFYRRFFFRVIHYKYFCGFWEFFYTLFSWLLYFSESTKPRKIIREIQIKKNIHILPLDTGEWVLNKIRWNNSLLNRLKFHTRTETEKSDLTLRDIHCWLPSCCRVKYFSNIYLARGYVRLGSERENELFSHRHRTAAPEIKEKLSSKRPEPNRESERGSIKYLVLSWESERFSKTIEKYPKSCARVYFKIVSAWMRWRAEMGIWITLNKIRWYHSVSM